MHLQSSDYLKNRFIAFWSLQAFQAGFINSVGFLDCKRFVSHVTGFGTQLGVALADHGYLSALEMLGVPLAFTLGAWFNGYCTVVRKTHGLAPRQDIVSLVIPFMLLALVIAGVNGCFGPFGAPLNMSTDFVYLSALTFVCGAQNACFSTLTHGQVRTTHLTGLCTDFGTDLSLVLSGNIPPEQKKMTKQKNTVRIFIFCSFFCGASVSALLDSHLEHWSLTIPMATSIVTAVVFVLDRVKRENRAEKLRAIAEPSI